MERLVEEYELDEVAEEIQRRYATPDVEERSSLRELADYFNKQLVKQSFEEAAVPTTNFDVENIYAQLYHADANPDDLTQIRKRLTYAGVPVEEIEQAFISHEAIRAYLRRQGIVYSEPEQDQIAKYREQIQQLRNRTAVVTDDKLQSLDSTGRITLGDFSVDVDIHVTCESCGVRSPLADVLADHGCDCAE